MYVGLLVIMIVTLLGSCYFYVTFCDEISIYKYIYIVINYIENISKTTINKFCSIATKQKALKL